MPSSSPQTEKMKSVCRAGRAALYDAYVSMGIAGMLLAQVFFNVGMCLYILPVMGLTLPFFSYGGSSIITLYTAMGIVSSIRARTLPSWLRDRNQL